MTGATMLFIAIVASVLAARPAGAQANARGDYPPAFFSSTSQYTVIRPGAPLPPLVLAGLDGKPREIAAGRGTVLLVNFWATWCAPCRRELPVLAGLSDELSGRGIEIMAVSIDRSARAAVKAFLDRLAVGRLNVLLDPAGRIAKTANEGRAAPFVLYGMPMTYVVDRRGAVAGYLTGEADWTSAAGRALLAHYLQQ